MSCHWAGDEVHLYVVLATNLSLQEPSTHKPNTHKPKTHPPRDTPTDKHASRGNGNSAYQRNRANVMKRSETIEAPTHKTTGRKERQAAPTHTQSRQPSYAHSYSPHRTVSPAEDSMMNTWKYSVKSTCTILATSIQMLRDNNGRAIQTCETM